MYFHVDSEVSYHSKSFLKDEYKWYRKKMVVKNRVWLISKDEPYENIQCILSSNIKQNQMNFFISIIFLKIALLKPGMVVHGFNPSIKEAESGRSEFKSIDWVPKQSGLQQKNRLKTLSTLQKGKNTVLKAWSCK